MKSFFLITSYTGGNHTELKSSHLIKFLQQIRKYVKDSFIIVIDGHYTNTIENYCDIFVHKKDNFNSPHGMGELSQIKLGLSILHFYNAKSFTKFNYDFWFNENIYKKYLEWQNLLIDKKIISSAWKRDQNDYGLPNSMACAFGVYEINAAKKLFYFDHVSYPIEAQLYRRTIDLFNPEDIYLYPHFMEAFGEETFDIFNDSGHNYSESRLNLINYENI